MAHRRVSEIAAPGADGLHSWTSGNRPPGSLAIFSNEAVEDLSMKSTMVALVLAGATVVASNTWLVQEADVRVICPMTIGGSFEAKTTALSGSVMAGRNGSSAFDGSFAVDLRTLDTGIALRNEHLRDNYLEVNNGPGFDTATLAGIDLTGFQPDAPNGKGSFTGLLTLHGVTRTVTGAVDVRQAGAGLRVKASFPVNLSDYSIRKPRYLGVGVKDTIQVEVAFAVIR
jgi:polyisoprenoid-binding protein YceI